MSGRCAAWSVAGMGGLLHALITFPNHYLFRTYALDLGLYTHTAWRYLHGQLADTALFQAQVTPMLADHFDLYLVLCSPLLLVFGTWTLLLVQWCSILLGAFGVRRYLLGRGLSARAAISGMALFLGFFGVLAASAFDYHSNVVAAMLLPWWMDAARRGRWRKAWVLFLLMLVAKENIGLWIGMVAGVLALERGVDRTQRRMMITMSMLGFGWSALVIGLLMPALAGDGGYAHLDYQLVGALFPPERGFSPVALVELVRGLFMDVVGGTVHGTAMKVEFWTLLLLSGGWALLVRPAWGLMALPLIAQKMWNDDPAKWSVFGQYGVEFAPLVAMAVPLVLAEWTAARPRTWVWWLAPLLAIGCTIRTMDATTAYIDRSRIRPYKAEHYHRLYDTDRVRALLAAVPQGAVVSAQSSAVPHLALRTQVYQFPIVRDAELIVLLPLDAPYPLDTASYRTAVEVLLHDPAWRAEVEDPAIILLRRVH